MTIAFGAVLDPNTVPVVHAVTTDEVIARADFIDVACGVMSALGGRGALHLRAGRATAARLQQLAEGLAAAQGLTGAWLVVNDRVDVALVTRAIGAQLTSRSLSVADARTAAPTLKLGASVHDVAEGVAAGEAGADWLVAGHVFETASHAGAPERGIEWLRALSSAATVPVIAIGGISLDKVRQVRGAGAHGLAVIRGIWDAPNAERAASDYLSSYDDAGDA